MCCLPLPMMTMLAFEKTQKKTMKVAMGNLRTVQG